jgi:hypothetical protein
LIIEPVTLPTVAQVHNHIKSYFPDKTKLAKKISEEMGNNVAAKKALINKLK